MVRTVLSTARLQRFTGGMTLTASTALLLAGGMAVSVTGCDSIEEAVTCAVIDGYRPTFNASFTAGAGGGTRIASLTLNSDLDIESGVTVTGLELGQGDISLTNGAGNGTVVLLVGVDDVVVAAGTVTVTNGQITGFPGTMTIGSFNASATAALSALSAAERGNLQLATSQTTARQAILTGLARDNFKLTVVGQFSNGIVGTATINSVGFVCAD